MEIKFAKLYDDAWTPTRKHDTDAGLDLYALGSYIVEPQAVKIVRTGITFEIPNGLVGLVWPKSRSNFLIGGGVIDSGYQGEVLVKVINPFNSKIVIANGDAVAQILFHPIVTTVVGVPKDFIHVKETSRADSGGIHLFEEKGTVTITNKDVYLLDEGDLMNWWGE